MAEYNVRHFPASTEEIGGKMMYFPEELNVTTYSTTPVHKGGRRERGAQLAAVVREWTRKGYTLERLSLSRSETPGFEHATYARYILTKES